MNRKRLTILIAVIIGMIACAALSYAMYTTQSSRKAVVATTPIEVPFSSNFMKLVGSNVSNFEVVSPVLSPGGDSKTVSFVVAVNNFPANRVSQTADKYITYDARFEISGGNGTYTIKQNGVAAKTVTGGTGTAEFSSTLKTGRHTDSYEITMPVADLGSVKIKASATPDNASRDTVNNKKLAAELHPRLAGITTAFECIGEFTDSNNAQGKKPYDYDAFNYHFYITKGTAEVILSWDKSKVMIDPAFKLRVVGNEVEQDNIGELKFTMDYDAKGSYDVIFYRVKSPDKNDSWQQSWSNMEDEKVITVNATEN